MRSPSVADWSEDRAGTPTRGWKAPLGIRLFRENHPRIRAAQGLYGGSGDTGGVYVNRSEDEFERWYRREHSRVLASMVVVTGNLDEAREVVDHAFAYALERWERVSRMDSPTGWTHAVAVNRARRRGRRSRRERELWSENLTRQVTAVGVSLEVWDAVGRLPRREREAIALRYLADLTEAETANAMGIAPGTVARTLHDARQKLAAELGTEPADGQGARR